MKKTEQCNCEDCRAIRDWRERRASAMGEAGLPSAYTVALEKRVEVLKRKLEAAKCIITRLGGCVCDNCLDRECGYAEVEE